MEIALGEWRLRTDPAENARDKVPYLRGCQSCRNFLAAVETLPGETQAFFRRLGLDIRPEKSKIVNLKHAYSDFLGFRIKVHKGKRNQYVVISHIAPKALDRIKETAKKKVKAIQHSSGEMEEFKAVSDYNSFVMGIHNYYRMETAASPDRGNYVRAAKHLLLIRITICK